MGKKIGYWVLILASIIFGGAGWLTHAMDNMAPKQEVKQKRGDTFSGAPASVKNLFDGNQTLKKGVTAEELNRTSKKYADNMSVQTLMLRGHRELLYTARMSSSKVIQTKQELKDYQSFVDDIKHQDLNYYLHNQKVLDDQEAQGKTNIYYVNKVKDLVHQQIVGDKVKSADLETYADAINKKVSPSLRDALVDQLALVKDDLKQQNTIKKQATEPSVTTSSSSTSSDNNRTTSGTTSSTRRTTTSRGSKHNYAPVVETPSDKDSGSDKGTSNSDDTDSNSSDTDDTSDTGDTGSDTGDGDYDVTVN